MPHGLFASLPFLCFPTFNRRDSKTCLLPKTFMLITYHLPKSFKLKEVSQGQYET